MAAVHRLGLASEHKELIELIASVQTALQAHVLGQPEGRLGAGHRPRGTRVEHVCEFATRLVEGRRIGKTID